MGSLSHTHSTHTLLTSTSPEQPPRIPYGIQSSDSLEDEASHGQEHLPTHATLAVASLDSIHSRTSSAPPTTEHDHGQPPLFGRRPAAQSLEDDDDDDDKQTHVGPLPDRCFALEARKPPPSSSIVSSGPLNSRTSTTPSIPLSRIARDVSLGVDNQPFRPVRHTPSLDTILSNGTNRDEHTTDVPASVGEGSVPKPSASVSTPGAEAMAYDASLVNPKDMSEDDMIRAALEASQQTPEPSRLPLDVAPFAVDNDQIEAWKDNARTVRVICASDDVDLSVLDFALQECQNDLKDIETLISQNFDEAQVDLDTLLELNGIVLNAIETGKDTANSFKKRAPVSTKIVDLDVHELVANKDVFSLICMLRSPQKDFRMEAALALLDFARAQKTCEGEEQDNRIRSEICSLGGMHSLLALFRTQGTIYELRVVAALAVAYVVPTFAVASSQVTPSLGLKILECLRFLITARSVTPNDKSITREESFASSAFGLTTFWVNKLEPMFTAEYGSSKLTTQEMTILGSPSTFFGHNVSDSIRGGCLGAAGVFDQPKELIELQVLLDETVSLILSTAKKADANCEFRGGDLVLLVEQICAIESAIPIAVREGILSVLLSWIRCRDREKIRPATSSLRSLTSIKDKYMAGWIHSQIVNQGALPDIVALTQDFSLGPDVRLAIAQILASLCVAPHTRAVVVESDCVHFLIDILFDHSNPASLDVVLFAAGALLQLAAGAVTRASVFNGKDTEFSCGVSSDKHDKLVDDIVQRGAVASLVAIVLERQGRLKRIAIGVLRVLSEDTSPVRQTRLRICEDGAAAALGKTLKVDVDRLFDALREGGQVDRNLTSDLDGIHETLCTLANVLRPIKGGLLQSSACHRSASNEEHVSTKLLIEGCFQTVQSGGLESLLRIVTLPLDGSLANSAQSSRSLLLKEACRSLVSLAPLLLSKSAASRGLSIWASEVLTSLHRLLKELVLLKSDCDDYSLDMHVTVLQGIGALAQCAPLRIRIVDKILLFLVQAKTMSKSSEITKAASRAFESLGFDEDTVTVQVAGTNYSLLADWFCLKRSLLLQAMARVEIAQTVRALWNLPLKMSELIRDVSDTSRSVSSSSGTKLFGSLVDDEDTALSREALLREYGDVYNRPGDSLHLPLEGDDENSELSRQIFPMSSTLAEAEWIFEHRARLKMGSKCVGLSSHVADFLRHCIPPRLLRDFIVPINTFSPSASFDFRSLMMPRRRYFSFRREGQLLSRICANEAGSTQSSSDHWNLVFTNSSFAGEFSESLVEVLYLCPMIRALSFTKDSERRATESSDDEDGAALLANLTASLPPWISCLSFDGLLHDSDVQALVAVLETMGKLSSGQALGTKQRTDIGPLSGLDSSPEMQAQGMFWLFAVSHSPGVTEEVWLSLFGLIGRSQTIPVAPPKSPLAALRALDLSFNNLGDSLCAMVLELAHDKDSGCVLERLDLSGNEIGVGTSVVKALKGYVLYHRREQMSGRKTAGHRWHRWKSTLHTLHLASNGLQIGKAWLEIISLLKNNALDLKVLDLSSNRLSLDENDYDCDVVVSSLLKNTSLSHLNLSQNSFTAESLDQVLKQLKQAAGDSGLPSLDFAENTPELSEEQAKLIREFSEHSRTALLQRCLNEQASPEMVHGEHGEDLSSRDLVGRETREEDDDTGQQREHPHSVSPSNVAVEDVGAGNRMIAMLFSAPLAWRDGNGTIHPFPKLDFNMERELMWQCLKEASRDIQLSFDTATCKRLIAAMTKQCTCLHYSGHGHEQYLPFEDESGGPHWLQVQQIKELIASREGGAPFRFVFVSACFSGLAGETFASAGVPHVVCCHQEFELKDAAARAFTRQFYLALAVGHTVKYSFEQGRKAVMATPNLKNADAEMKKFVLLPADGNHHVPVFDAKPVLEWPRRGNKISTSRDRRGSRSKTKAIGGTKTSELSVRNMIQEDPSPSPPHFFMGREVDMYLILREILGKRLVSVVGEIGVGRSSLVLALAHYINERASTMTFIDRIYYIKAKQGEKRNRVRALVQELGQKVAGWRKMDIPSTGDDTETQFDAVCRILKSEKALIIFDHVELLEKADEANEFPVLLSNLFRETRNVRVLLTANAPLGIPSLGGQVEHHYRLGPLNFGNSVRLFSKLTPHLYTPSDRRTFIERLLTNESEVELLPIDSALGEATRHIFAATGNGIPSQIEKAAYTISADNFRDLSSGRVGQIRGTSDDIDVKTTKAKFTESRKDNVP